MAFGMSPRPTCTWPLERARLSPNRPHIQRDLLYHKVGQYSIIYSLLLSLCLTACSVLKTHPSAEVCHPNNFKQAWPHGLCSDWFRQDSCLPATSSQQDLQWWASSSTPWCESVVISSSTWISRILAWRVDTPQIVVTILRQTWWCWSGKAITLYPPRPLHFFQHTWKKNLECWLILWCDDYVAAVWTAWQCTLACPTQLITTIYTPYLEVQRDHLAWH